MITSLEALLGHTEMVDILPYEISAKRREPESPAPAGGQSTEMGVSWQRQADKLVVRLRMPIVTDDAEILADIGAVYTLDSALEIDTEVMTEFIAKVGVLAAYPFVRETVFGLATRLRIVPPVLGIIHGPDPSDLIPAQTLPI